MIVAAQKKRNGAAAVELAVVLPLLLLLFAVGVDFARVYYFAQIVSNGARVGALYASNPDVADRTPYETTQEAMRASLGDLQPEPNITIGEGLDKLGHRYAEVTVQYKYRPVTRFAGLRSSQPLTSTARARLYPAAVVDREGQ
jgi:Flp pilus assembly protein TadG